MPLGNNQNEADLIRHLAATLVENEVMLPMAQIGWGHGTPPAPQAGTTPASEGAPSADPQTVPPVPNGPPAPVTVKHTAEDPDKANAPQKVSIDLDIEMFKDPETGLYNKKYKTPEEFIRGIGHAVTMAKEAFNQRDAAIAEAERLRNERAVKATQTVETPSTASPSPSIASPSRAAVDKAQEAYDAVLSKIASEGGMLDEDSTKQLSKAQRELTEATAEFISETNYAKRTNNANADRDKWAAVDSYMSENHPEALELADEIGLYVQSDPLLQEAVQALVAQGKEIKASVYAWQAFDKYRQTQTETTLRADAVQKETTMEAQEQVRREAVEKARKDAGIINGSAGGAGIHERPNTGSASQEEIEKAILAMRRAGGTPGTAEGARWRELVIGSSLPSSLFGS